MRVGRGMDADGDGEEGADAETGIVERRPLNTRFWEIG